MNNLIEKINQELLSIIEKDSNKSNLSKASEYMLVGQGKRIRPLLVLSLCKDINNTCEEFVRESLTIELLHTASLVHDDLPALDNDDYRRGKESCHKKFGEAVAILTGDYLQALAFKILCESKLDSKVINKLSHSLADSFTKICHGQEMDMISSDIENISTVHALKTAALFSCCFEFAGILTNQNKENVSRLNKLGYHLGMYFQILDDYFDCYGSKKVTGRLISSDIKNDKVTIFRVDNYTKKEALVLIKRRQKDLSLNIDKLEKHIDVKFNFLREVISLVDARLEVE